MRFFFKRKFSQNFLHDRNIIQNIINFINFKFKDKCIEIGPGLAALTEPICKLVEKLYVVEIDKTIVEILKKKKFFNKLIIFKDDILNFNFDKISKDGDLIRVFGNIPYNISTPLLMHLIKFYNIIKDIYIMLQKEVADRLSACPGNKNYGRLSIIMQYYYKIKNVFTISSNSFYPKPKVQSIFVFLKPYINKKPYFLKNVDILSLITKLAFTQRRKCLYNSLSAIVSKDDLLKLNIQPFLRAGDISIQQYCDLANYLSK
ncbi:16S rRNA (adenine(1518)-N(6)/adenine(1519)-N(6))-dimethyltransferase RsmA [Buchnera aphidicola (Mollitrichosiphum nigrofasciatum)]|uniref:16S rRNA (adenine(1518)-N(6)/adenine(1519)-N(6))- dimethyltransferase RsmA n=1 Tax=Buchnera aphidicola TaxID=9 RepID=UPI0031B83A90